MLNKEKKAEILRERYQNDKKIVIAGMNDSQLNNGILNYIAKEFRSAGLDPTVISTCSLRLNKTEHYDYFLANNVTVEEIKLSQIYSAVSALEKVGRDIHAPGIISEIMGKAGYAFKLVHRVKPNDHNIHLTDTIKEAERPIIIHSSGVNNLMREVGNDPSQITKAYENRNISSKYDYNLERARDPQTIKTVLEGEKRNFIHTYQVNPNANIFSLGVYNPKQLNGPGMELFLDLTHRYTEEKKKLCREYHVTFVNTEMIGEKYHNGGFNPHVSNKGRHALGNILLNHILVNTGNDFVTDYVQDTSDETPTAMGMYGVCLSIFRDIENLKNSNSEGYQGERQLEIIDEHRDEIGICKEVMRKELKYNYFN